MSTYLSIRNRPVGGVSFYAVTNIWNPVRKVQDKKQVYLGSFSDKGYKFNQRALEYAPLFKGTEHESGYWSWRSQQSDSTEVEVLVPRRNIQRGTSTYVGNSVLLGAVAKELKLDQLLAQTFGTPLAQNILAIAYYCASHVRNPLIESVGWSEHQRLPGDVKLSVSSIDKTLQSISERSINKFMMLWQKAHPSAVPLAVEIKPVNSYHRNNEEIALGMFKYLNTLQPYRLLVTLDRKTHTPINYELISTDEPDVTTINNILDVLHRQNNGSADIVLGRDFSVFRNVRYLLRNKIRFTSVVAFENFPNSQIEIDQLKKSGEFDKNSKQLEIFQRDEILKVQAVTKVHNLEGTTVYLHYYYIDEYRKRTAAQLKDRLARVQRRLEKGLALLNDYDQMLANEFFTVKISAHHGRTVKQKSAQLDETIKNTTGYFALMSNCLSDPADALKAYKAREGLEDRFDDQKQEEDFYRLNMYSFNAEQARNFIQLVAQMMRFYILNKLHNWKNKPEKIHSVTEIIRTMELLREISIRGHNPFLEQPDETQQAILSEFGILLPHNGN